VRSRFPSALGPMTTLHLLLEDVPQNTQPDLDRQCLQPSSARPGVPMLPAPAGSTAPSQSPERRENVSLHGGSSLRYLSGSPITLPPEADGPEGPPSSQSSTSDDDPAISSLSRDCCPRPTIRNCAIPPRSNATARTANEPRFRCPRSCSARPVSDRRGHPAPSATKTRARRRLVSTGLRQRPACRHEPGRRRAP
jgi:hypothetical protein